jgi:Rrf2 family protein
MFSKTCEYAIRAVLYIAQKADEQRKISIKEIAEEIGSPVHFIAKILQELSRKGIVQSIKGPNGGFYLNAKSRSQPLMNVILAIDGDKVFKNCALGLGQCSGDKPCPLHHEFQKIKSEMEQVLRESSLDSFSEALNSQLTFLNVLPE